MLNGNLFAKVRRLRVIDDLVVGASQGFLDVLGKHGVFSGSGRACAECQCLGTRASRGVPPRLKPWTPGGAVRLLGAGIPGAEAGRRARPSCHEPWNLSAAGGEQQARLKVFLFQVREVGQ